MPNLSTIPPWLQAADPSAHLAQGMQMGMQMGAQEAAQRFRQQQEIRQQQEFEQTMAMHQAQMGLQTQEFSLKSQETARRSQAMLQYQQALSGGADPLQTILQYGPAMGQQASAEAAAIRAQNMAPKPILAPPADPDVLDLGGKKFARSFGRNGAYTLHPINEAQHPTWVPANDQTGEPAHWESATGVPHVPTATRNQGLSLRDKLAALRQQEKELAADPILSRRITKETSPEIAAEFTAAKTKRDALQKQIDAILSSGDPKPATQLFTDKSGKTWQYTGKASDPLSDHSPDSWQEADTEEGTDAP